MYLDRDLTGINPGEVWVADHHQLDVAVRIPTAMIFDGFDKLRTRKTIDSGKIAFPWFTAFSDFRTSRMLGYVLHIEPPNSDHIMGAAQHAATRFGVCRAMILDNGKDFRCRDFAGGRVRNYKLQLDEQATQSFVSGLGIQVVWAIPYSPQTKTIERSFRIVKERFGKFAVGYRGGDVTERPERLEGEIRRGEIMDWDVFCTAFEQFVERVFNTSPSNGKHLEGLSPAQAWTSLRRDDGYMPHRVTEQALAIYCMRVGKPKRIARNGWHDEQINLHYWGEWMAGMRGVSVYMRRDPRAWQTGWFFDAGTNEYLGVGELLPTVPGLARNDLDRAQVRELIKMKQRDRKLKKELARVDNRPDSLELGELMSAANAALAPVEGDENVGNVSRLTWADGIAQQRQSERATGTYDLAKIMPPEPPRKRKYALFESDLEEDE
jgi:hypothetical protein